MTSFSSRIFNKIENKIKIVKSIVFDFASNII